MVGIRGRWDVIGENLLLGMSESAVSAKALTFCRIMFLNAADFLYAMRISQELYTVVVDYLSERYPQEQLEAAPWSSGKGWFPARRVSTIRDIAEIQSERGPASPMSPFPQSPTEYSALPDATSHHRRLMFTMEGDTKVQRGRSASHRSSRCLASQPSGFEHPTLTVQRSEMSFMSAHSDSPAASAEHSKETSASVAALLNVGVVERQRSFTSNMRLPRGEASRVAETTRIANQMSFKNSTPTAAHPPAQDWDVFASSGRSSAGGGVPQDVDMERPASSIRGRGRWRKMPLQLRKLVKERTFACCHNAIVNLSAMLTSSLPCTPLHGGPRETRPHRVASRASIISETSSHATLYASSMSSSMFGQIPRKTTMSRLRNQDP